MSDASTLQKEQTGAGAPITGGPSGQLHEVATGIRAGGLGAQRQTSGLLMEGTGEPATVGAHATLVLPQERMMLDHAIDDAARPISQDKVHYVEHEQSDSYKQRETEKLSRQP